MDAVRQPDIRAEPSEFFKVFDRTHSEAFDTKGLLVQGLGHMGVESHTPAPRQLSGFDHQLSCNRERRAWSDRNLQHRLRRGVVPTIDRLTRRDQDGFSIFDCRVRWETTGRLSEVHRASAWVKAQSELAGGCDLGGEEVSTIARENVVVIGGERTPGPGQGSEPGK